MYGGNGRWRFWLICCFWNRKRCWVHGPTLIMTIDWDLSALNSRPAQVRAVVQWESKVWAPETVADIRLRSSMKASSKWMVRMDVVRMIGAGVEFFRLFEFSQCFNKLDLFMLFRTRCFNNALVKMSILTCLAHRIRLLTFTKLPQM